MGIITYDKAKGILCSKSDEEKTLANGGGRIFDTAYIVVEALREALLGDNEGIPHFELITRIAGRCYMSGFTAGVEHFQAEFPTWVQSINLKTLRGKRNLEDVALAVGVSPSELQAYENGERVPGNKFRQRIADYYGETAEDVFCESVGGRYETKEKRV
jgi:transcriptional regulator with XRE-family HTH domain